MARGSIVSCSSGEEACFVDRRRVSSSGEACLGRGRVCMCMADLLDFLDSAPRSEAAAGAEMSQSVGLSSPVTSYATYPAAPF